MKNDKNTCTPCEQNFENKIDELVNEGKKPTAAEHIKKDIEIHEAFDKKKE